MDKILHDPKDPKLWELWYIPYNGSCRILSISRIYDVFGAGSAVLSVQTISTVGDFGVGSFVVTLFRDAWSV